MYYIIKYDYENNADQWWDALRMNQKLFDAVTTAADESIVSGEVFAQLKALPGFSDGPPHARNALLFHPIQVHDMLTGAALSKPPSMELIRQARQVSDGVVPAYKRDERWEYVPPAMKDFYRARGEHVRTVYVVE